MFDTIKSKIVFLTTILVLGLILILSFGAFVNYKNYTYMKTDECDFTISVFAEQVNREIIKLSNNAADLASLGELYIKTGKSEQIAEYGVKDIFKNYKDSLGGGIWFEPFAINPSKLLKCTYAFNKNGEIVIDRNFESKEYNYLQQSWYREIKPVLSEENYIAWSRPYYDEEGSHALMTTVGAGIYDKSQLVGISTVDWKIDAIVKTISEMKPTRNSFALFADKKNDCIIVSTDKYLQNEDIRGMSLHEIPWYSESLNNKDIFVYNNKKYVSYTKNLENGMVLIVNVPTNELFSGIILNVLFLSLILLFAGLTISVLIYSTLKKNVNKPIEDFAALANEIGKGNLDEKIEISEPREFAQLANTFNKMTDDIKTYIDNIGKITSEKEKIESELSIARKIQYSVLPSEFFSNIEEVELYATMDTAKEVGGDFYDFFFIDDNKLMFLIADVSGKGIPAALFMMTTKVLIKNIAKEGYSPKDLIEKVNRTICENNKQGFFVTMFCGILNINNGHIAFVDCGHNLPLIKRSGNDFEYLKTPANLVLGVSETFQYEIYESVLKKGDELFLYTDGVSEAENIHQEQYGENRLKDCINRIEQTSGMKIKLEKIKADVTEHIGGIEQNDDITMLGLRYNGSNNSDATKDKFVTIAKVENFNLFRDWMDNLFDRLKIPAQQRMKAELVTEEIFVNIASYAYLDFEQIGNIEVLFEKNDNEIIFTFTDNGVKYNPLENPEPDVTLSVAARQIGGLGIFMVKKNVDYLGYEYIDGKNVLTMKINLI